MSLLINLKIWGDVEDRIKDIKKVKFKSVSNKYEDGRIWFIIKLIRKDNMTIKEINELINKLEKAYKIDDVEFDRKDILIRIGGMV